MEAVWFLIIFPLIAAVGCLVCPGERLRHVIVYVSAAVIAVAAIALAASYLGGYGTYFVFYSPVISVLLFLVELVLCAYVMWRALQARRYAIFALAAVQAVLACALEFSSAGHVDVQRAVYIDTLSSIMVLIIGVIGSGIIVYAVGYMKDFQRHHEEEALAAVRAAEAAETAAANAEPADKEAELLEASPADVTGQIPAVEADTAATAAEAAPAASTPAPTAAAAAAPADHSATHALGLVTDNRNRFFAAMFVFLSAMFGTVTFNHLGWLLCAWEVTTVCSFYLIGYTRTPEATKNAFTQIWMNLIGGIAFCIAVLIIGIACNVMELSSFISLGVVAPSAVMLPLALLAVAAITKAAQMPFHGWLLGAMVAPTPTSALLHSSTMVKAGVFLLIRLSPLMGVFVSGLPRLGINPVGMSVMLVGIVTFLLAALIAMSQSNAKRVLAYSTVSNLGLIVCCAAIGTPTAVWAAICLLLFHACAKSLLFLCVGTAEHHLGSRNIECMDSLLTRMPRLTAFMAFGICAMFVAPFGMLVAKWIAVEAIAMSGVLIVVIAVVFGSAATFFFWAKWLAKIVAGTPGATNVEKDVHTPEWVAIGLMGGLAGICSILLPLISADIVAPYVRRLTGGAVTALSQGDLVLMAILTIVLFAIPAVLYLYTRNNKLQRGEHQPYFGGAGRGHAAFMNSLSKQTSYTQRNWYFEGMFDEKTVSNLGILICVILIGMGTAASLGLTVIFLGSVI